MKSGVLYYPTLSTFPFADMYYLEDSLTVVSINVTFARSTNVRKFTTSQYLHFLEKLGLVKNAKQENSDAIGPRGVRIKFVIVTHPLMADTTYVNDEGSSLAPSDISIWKVPPNYR